MFPLKEVKEALWSLEAPPLLVTETEQQNGEEGVIRLFLDRLEPTRVLEEFSIVRERVFTALLWVLTRGSTSSDITESATKKLSALAGCAVSGDLVTRWHRDQVTLHEVRFITPA